MLAAVSTYFGGEKKSAVPLIIEQTLTLEGKRKRK